jgi:hypothetical protein
VVVVSIPLGAQRLTRRVFVRATAGGAPQLDLTAADFSLVENGAKREVTRAAVGKAPMRIVLLVDSSTAVAQMLNPIRQSLTTFLDDLPPEHEVAFITTGGQLRIRAQPNTDRAKLKAEVQRFASDGGGNAFLDTLLESDRRMLKPVTQWPVFVIVTTDNGEARGDVRIEDYNKFLDDFLVRGGSAHGVVIKGPQSGPVSSIAENLVQNTGGIHETINIATGLEERLKKIAARLAGDHAKMANIYEIDFTSDAKIKQPQVEIGTSRPGVMLQILPRRPS